MRRAASSSIVRAPSPIQSLAMVIRSPSPSSTSSENSTSDLIHSRSGGPPHQARGRPRTRDVGDVVPVTNTRKETATSLADPTCPRPVPYAPRQAQGADRALALLSQPAISLPGRGANRDHARLLRPAPLEEDRPTRQALGIGELRRGSTTLKPSRKHLGTSAVNDHPKRVHFRPDL